MNSVVQDARKIRAQAQYRLSEKQRALTQEDSRVNRQIPPYPHTPQGSQRAERNVVVGATRCDPEDSGDE